MAFFEELKRRNVLRVGAAYSVAAWLLIQVTATVFPLFELEPSAARLVVIILIIGAVPALILTWAFEWTPDGLRKDSDVDKFASAEPQDRKRLDRIIIILLALALGYFAFDKFVLDPSRDAAREVVVAEQARTEALVDSYGDHSIAVLPFINMSSDPEQDYFSDGISEELLNLLAGVDGLRVISRSSAFSFRDQDLEIPEIARRLNVAHILEGSVRKAGNQVRITAQLIEARSDTHLWSDTWDRELENIFAIQDEIAAEVVDQLKITLLGDVPSSRKTDPEAFNLFLQGRFFLDQFTPQSLEKAAGIYQKALAIDPDYPPALKGLAEIYANQASWGLVPFQEAIDSSRQLVNRALTIDPLYADVYAGLGSFAQYFDGDMKSAAIYFKKAVELGPNQASIIGDAGVFALYLGRANQAIELFELQLSLDPVSPTAHSQMARALVAAGRFEEAIEAFQMVLNLSPGRIGAHYGLGIALLLSGNLQAALEAMQHEEFKEFQLTGLALVHHGLGQTDKADAAQAELTEQYGEQSAYSIAVVCAFRNDIEAAFKWLERAEEANDSSLTGVSTSIFLAGLKSDARWEALLERLGTSEEQLGAINFDLNLPGLEHSVKGQ